jgi:hypothetical protein
MVKHEPELHSVAVQGVLLVGDTGFEPVTSSVSVISDTPDNAAAGVSQVHRCTQLIAGCRTD